MIIRNSHSSLLDYHFRRLNNGAKVLGLNPPAYFTQKYLRSVILQVRETIGLFAVILRLDPAILA
jgi:hypothetical protein